MPRRYIINLRDPKNPNAFQALIRDIQGVLQKIEDDFNAMTATVDTISGAERVTLYNSLGLEIPVPPGGVYCLPVGVMQSAASAAGTTVWAMRNGATKTVRLRRILLNFSFFGTAAASIGVYSLHRFTTATPTGGSALNPLAYKSNYPASTVADVRSVDTGLTTTSVVFSDAFAYVAGTRAVAATTPFNLQFTPYVGRNDALELAPNEGLAIRIAITAVIGDALAGTIEWDEL